MGLVTGPIAIVAKRYARDCRRSDDVLMQSAVPALLLGILMATITALFRKAILSLIGTEEALNLGCDDVSLVSLSSQAIFMTLLAFSALR